MSDSHQPLIILGASTRAAAFSALRAGLQPWCADLFADLDLQARCPVERRNNQYPHGLALAPMPPGPWIYTGALENWPDVIAAWQEQRPLWGVRSECLEWVRDPIRLARICRNGGLPTPRTQSWSPEVDGRRWLVKVRRSAGGAGVREWGPNDDHDVLVRRHLYWQEYVDGSPVAALYAATGEDVVLLGLTRQLIGLPWLHARGFQYCGSIGPLAPPPELRSELVALGRLLGRRCSLAGLFGVDGILAKEHFWPVEVNPRYTASVEVLEYATGLHALAWHRRAFDRHAPKPPEPASGVGFVGKAILFAPKDLVFPEQGPWLSELRSPTALHLAPDFADIPAPGEVIPRGRPILSFFVHKAKLVSCEDALQAIADDLTRRLFPPASFGSQGFRELPA